MSSGEADLHAACMATQHGMETESMARELGVRLDAMELQVDASAVTGIIDRQGTGERESSGLESLVAADTIDPHVKKLECVRFDQ